MIKQCRICKEQKAYPDEFVKNGKYRGRAAPSSYCKACHSLRVWVNKKEKMKALEPDQWLDCSNEECGNIWRRIANYTDGRRSPIWLNCKKCGSVGE